MIGSLRSLFGSKPETDFSELMRKGAVIIDVRSKAEYQSGHIAGSKNIPLNSLGQNLKKIGNKNSPVITCCASGMRSATALGILKSSGFEEVHNGGGWKTLQNKLG